METTTAQAKERPILFSGEMIRSILDGRKTQTRLVVKTSAKRIQWNPIVVDGYAGYCDEHGNHYKCPYGKPGDRLWVRETFCWPEDYSIPIYRADGEGLPPMECWYPSIHMPRAASRILLEITDVRVERLQEISEADAKAEGVKRAILGVNGGISGQQTGQEPKPYRQSFAELWQPINGPESWQANPFVWAITFKRIEP